MNTIVTTAQAARIEAVDSDRYTIGQYADQTSPFCETCNDVITVDHGPAGDAWLLNIVAAVTDHEASHHGGTRR